MVHGWGSIPHIATIYQFNWAVKDSRQSITMQSIKTILCVLAAINTPICCIWAANELWEISKYVSAIFFIDGFMAGIFFLWLSMSINAKNQ